MNLNKQKVAELTRLAKANNTEDEIHFDDTLKGFGLRLRRGADDRLSGSYVVQYRINGRTRRMKVGAIEKLGTDEARKKARKILAEVELGGDPAADKSDKRARAAHRMLSVAEQYLEAKKQTLRRSSYKVARLYLTGDAYFKPLHTMPVSEIELEHVAACLRQITKKVSSHTAAAARTALSTMFTWAMGEGLMGPRPANPVVGTNAPAESEPRDRVLEDAELAAIWKACADDEHGRIVKLLALTGCRRDEIGRMRWAEIDFDTGTLSLPAERVKNKHQHRLPLSDMAVDIIKATLRRLGREHVFGGHRGGERGGGFSDWTRQKHALDERSGVSRWVLHDLRRTAATRMADLGVQPHVIEEALNHRSGHRRGVAGTYNRSTYEPEVRAALAKWADHLSEIVDRPRLRKIV
jgi:integrase